jgi:hypothetical protein
VVSAAAAAVSNLISHKGFEYVLTVNEQLANNTREFEAPTVVHSTIMSDGYGRLILT